MIGQTFVGYLSCALPVLPAFLVVSIVKSLSSCIFIIIPVDYKSKINQVDGVFGLSVSPLGLGKPHTKKTNRQPKNEFKMLGQIIVETNFTSHRNTSSRSPPLPAFDYQSSARCYHRCDTANGFC
jgi:hypothetical protein